MVLWIQPLRQILSGLRKVSEITVGRIERHGLPDV
jgi:hypothetical protein